MIPPESKQWMVRTRDREVLGPFTQRQLIEELNKNTFTADDEIAPHAGLWMSAQTLLHRDIDEITRTSTRHTNTHSLTGSGENTFTPTPTPTITPPDEHSTRPDFKSNLARKLDYRPEIPSPQVPTQSNRVAPFVTAIFLFSLLGVIVQLRMKSNPSNPALINSSKKFVADSPFVRRIYQMISRGEHQAALKELLAYDEKRPEDIEYLVPYAALLILEEESASRAKKLLERVLASNAADLLKAQAHLWMGYLLLSTDEGDMGESHFLEALQLNPKDAASRFNLGRAYLKQEKFAQAHDYLQLAELEVPDLWLIHLYKGRVKVALGNMEDARASFRLAIESAPDRWLVYIYYSLFLLANKDLDEARLTIRKMLTRDPDFEVNTPTPFGFYQEKVDYREYLSAFNEVMQRSSPEEKELGRLYLGFLLNGTRGPDGKRLQMLAEHGSILSRVVSLKTLLAGQPSADELKNALSLVNGSLTEFGAYAYIQRGEAKFRLNRIQEAQQDFLQALLVEPKSASGHWAMYQLYQRTNQKERAMKELDTLLSYHPQFIPAIVASQE